jgi:glycosyltransferase involved in cell wall biosynthesis
MDRFEILKQTLPSVATQGFHEIIVVDSSKAEANKIRELCRSLGVKYYHRVCNREEARNFGVEKASGDWVYILDDDCFIESFNLKKFERLAGTFDFIIDSPQGYAWIFRKSFFSKIGGYDVKLCYGDDYDITARAFEHGIGGLAKLGAGYHVKGELKMRWKGIFYYGLTMLTFWRKYPRRTQALNSPLSIPYRAFVFFRDFIHLRTRESFHKFILTLAGVLFSPIYPNWLYCTHCGVWIEAEFPSFSNIEGSVKFDVKGNPICPRCGRRLRTKPRYYYGRRIKHD